jgi:hypothetical protein
MTMRERERESANIINTIIIIIIIIMIVLITTIITIITIIIIIIIIISRTIKSNRATTITFIFRRASLVSNGKTMLSRGSVVLRRGSVGRLTQPSVEAQSPAKDAWTNERKADASPLQVWRQQLQKDCFRMFL